MSDDDAKKIIKLLTSIRNTQQNMYKLLIKIGDANANFDIDGGGWTDVYTYGKKQRHELSDFVDNAKNNEENKININEIANEMQKKKGIESNPNVDHHVEDLDHPHDKDNQKNSDNPQIKIPILHKKINKKG